MKELTTLFFAAFRAFPKARHAPYAAICSCVPSPDHSMHRKQLAISFHSFKKWPSFARVYSRLSTSPLIQTPRGEARTLGSCGIVPPLLAGKHVTDNSRLAAYQQQGAFFVSSWLSIMTAFFLLHTFYLDTWTSLGSFSWPRNLSSASRTSASTVRESRSIFPICHFFSSVCTQSRSPTASGRATVQKSFVEFL